MTKEEQTSVNIENPGAENSSLWDRELTRRDFLRLAAGAAAGAAARVVLPGGTVRPLRIEAAGPESIEIVPRNLHGVEVLGLSEEGNSLIDTEEKVLTLQRFIFNRFNQELDEKARQDPHLTPEKAEKIIRGDYYTRREYFLKPNTRFLQVVARESVFRSFKQRQAETGVDLIQWLQMHVDMFNRLMENSNPSSPARIALLRLIIVGDNFKQRPSALRPVIDWDGDWFLDKDYRPQTKDDFLAYSWSVSSTSSGDLVVRWPPGEKEVKKEVSFPCKKDSLASKNGVLIDFGLIEEFTHATWCLPDKYVLCLKDTPFQYPNFYFEPGGGPFCSPDNSPYDLARLEELRKRGRTTVDKEGAGVFGEVFGEVPDKIEIKLTALQGIKRMRVFRLQPDQESLKTEEDYQWIQYKPKISVETPLEVDGSTVRFDKLTEPLDFAHQGEKHRYYPTNFVIEYETEKGSSGTLHLPCAPFNISKWNGLNSARYEIFITGYENPERKTQVLRMVDKAETLKVLKEEFKRGYCAYALMRIDGTSTYCFWFLR